MCFWRTMAYPLASPKKKDTPVKTTIKFCKKLWLHIKINFAIVWKQWSWTLRTTIVTVEVCLCFWKLLNIDWKQIWKLRCWGSTIFFFLCEIWHKWKKRNILSYFYVPRSPNWKKNCHINSTWILERGVFLIPTL
jgi:hypothetical protein